MRSDVAFLFGNIEPRITSEYNQTTKFQNDQLQKLHTSKYCNLRYFIWRHDVSWELAINKTSSHKWNFFLLVFSAHIAEPEKIKPLCYTKTKKCWYLVVITAFRNLFPNYVTCFFLFVLRRVFPNFCVFCDLPATNSISRQWLSVVQKTRILPSEKYLKEK